MFLKMLQIVLYLGNLQLLSFIFRSNFKCHLMQLTIFAEYTLVYRDLYLPYNHAPNNPSIYSIYE